MTATAAVKTPSLMTLEQFLAWDGSGFVGKLELIDGVVRAMAPASATHAIIQGNIVTAFNNHLRARKSACQAGTEAPIVPPMGKRANARAPDVSVTCSPVSDNGTFEDPVLIVEVMSPSNEAETWESIRALAALTSLQEVLVVQSTEVKAELYRRAADGDWPTDPDAAGAGGSLRLDSIGLSLTVETIYEGTQIA
jgi:Uma2 family endonuclease